LADFDIDIQTSTLLSIEGLSSF